MSAAASPLTIYVWSGPSPHIALQTPNHYISYWQGACGNRTCPITPHRHTYYGFDVGLRRQPSIYRLNFLSAQKIEEAYQAFRNNSDSYPKQEVVAYLLDCGGIQQYVPTHNPYLGIVKMALFAQGFSDVLELCDTFYGKSTLRSVAQAELFLNTYRAGLVKQILVISALFFAAHIFSGHLSSKVEAGALIHEAYVQNGKKPPLRKRVLYNAALVTTFLLPLTPFLARRSEFFSKVEKVRAQLNAVYVQSDSELLAGTGTRILKKIKAWMGAAPFQGPP